MFVLVMRWEANLVYVYILMYVCVGRGEDRFKIGKGHEVLEEDEMSTL